MKKTTITQLEIAQLAASLPTGTARERVELAAAIWRESAMVPEIAGHRVDQLEADHEAQGEAMRAAGLIDDEKPTLRAFLKTIMPTMDSHGDRVKIWRDFLKHSERISAEHAASEQASKLAAIGTHNMNAQPIADDEIERRALDRMTIQREHGIRKAPELVATFTAWNDARQKAVLSERGRTGGRPKKAIEKKTLGRVKSAKKPHKF